MNNARTVFELGKIYKHKNPVFPYQSLLRYKVIYVDSEKLIIETVDADKFTYEYNRAEDIVTTIDDIASVLVLAE